MRKTGKIKRIAMRAAAVLLALEALLSLAACGGAGAGAETTADAETEAQTLPPEPEKLDLTKYVVVRPDETSGYFADLYTNFVRNLKTRTGASLNYTNDFVMPGTQYKEAEYEILLGPTNRKESAAALEGKSHTAYAVTVIGTKIVITGASRSAIEYALNQFLKKCVTRGSAEVDPALIDICGDEPSDEYYEVLEGVRMVAMGDSYFGQNKEICWPRLLADDYHMKFRNYGIGGSTLSNYDTTKHPMVDRWQETAAGADIVLLEGGRNDFNVSAPLGEVDGRDPATEAGAINLILDGFQQKYPEALIICITGWYVNEKMQPYVEMMKKVCAARGVVCFDASDQALTGVYMNNASFRAAYCLDANDISHLNAQGMALVEPVFEKFIAEEYQKFLDAKKQ